MVRVGGQGDYRGGGYREATGGYKEVDRPLSCVRSGHWLVAMRWLTAAALLPMAAISSAAGSDAGSAATTATSSGRSSRVIELEPSKLPATHCCRYCTTALCCTVVQLTLPGVDLNPLQSFREFQNGEGISKWICNACHRRCRAASGPPIAEIKRGCQQLSADVKRAS